MKITVVLAILLLCPQGASLSNNPIISRRSALTFGVSTVCLPFAASAAEADCFADCLKNCKLIAPKDPAYCNENCKSYCDQPDRTDGLSGSISADNGETGILGYGTTVKGADSPPSLKLPGLDFTTSPAGRKLIGY